MCLRPPPVRWRLGFFEYGELPSPIGAGDRKPPSVDREPCDGVAVGRRVAPALSVLQTDVEVVDACGGTNRAAGPP